MWLKPLSGSLLVGALFVVASQGCSGSGGGAGFTSSSGGSSGGSGRGSSGASGGASSSGDLLGGDGGHATPPGACSGLQCQQHSCPNGGTTTISGKVYDPALANPLYNVVVYVPNTAVKPLPTGASCASCNSLFSGDPIATALTDASGAFTLKNAPDGADIPLVIQVGKWRKQVKIPKVTACTDNAQPDKSLSLPKNHTVGDIPNIAISTGGADTMECLLHRVGLDNAEYGGGGAGAGKIHVFGGSGRGVAPNTNPPGPSSSSALWQSKDALMAYDIVILSCEGSETGSMNQQALFDYAGAGGRVFSSHFHYAWFNSGPFGAQNIASWSPGSNDMGDIQANIVTTFPKGQALKDWLGNVGALQNGELPIQAARHNADVSAANTASQAWISADNNANPANATEYLSFNTPIGVAADKQCGRVVFSDLHVGAASRDYPNPLPPPFGVGMTAPDGCASNGLSPQEKALEFMLFDLSSCVQPDNQPPQPPPPVVR